MAYATAIVKTTSTIATLNKRKECAPIPGLPKISLYWQNFNLLKFKLFEQPQLILHFNAKRDVLNSL